MLISAKLAPCFDYAVLEEFWRGSDELGFHAVWDYDHFYGLTDPAAPTFEGWTTLTAMAARTRRARIGCMVTGVTYRHPAVLAKMAVTVDHVSGGRLEFGIGAAWHEPEHRGYGIEFPPNGTRVAMLDEALDVIKLLWTQEVSSYEGRFFTLNGARCEPKPVQSPHPPIVVGASLPRMLRLTAKHADEWNAPSQGPEEWARQSKTLDGFCADLGRDPSAVRRSVQLFLYPQQEGQMEELLATLPAYENAGCEHVVLSFYQPPTRAQLEALRADDVKIRSTLPELPPDRVRSFLDGLPEAAGYEVIVKPLRYRTRPHLAAYTEFDEQRITIQVPEPFLPFGEIVQYGAKRIPGKGMRFVWLSEGLTFRTERQVVRFLYCHEWYHWYLKEVLRQRSAAETACDRFALLNFRRRIVTREDAQAALHRR